ncbi:MAG: YicC family protein [Lachnospiraceae bacterium]|nr:YicC family protein [Lachnospiraceae bacterium]
MKSMTGFGRGEVSDQSRKFTVEIKGVNHRYLDINIRMPKKLNIFESELRSLVKESVSRGKTDIFITYEDSSLKEGSLKYNSVLAKEYMKYFSDMQEEFGLEYDVTVSTLAKCPDVLVLEEQDTDEEELWNLLKSAVVQALEQFSASRTKEGENLRDDILKKLALMKEKLALVEVRSPQIIAEYREKIEAKVTELLTDTQIEESRIAAEVVLFADKIATDEEIVRLKSHIERMGDTFKKSEGGSGRKLDFIAQEMNREANTILSKANDIEVSNLAIDLKTEIEKIREQIQNIE